MLFLFHYQHHEQHRGDDDGNQQHLRAQLGADMLNDILDVFNNDTVERLTLLSSALTRRDLETVAKQAHSIKGSAASLGLNGIVKSAASLETAAVNQEEPTALQALFEDLEQRHVEFDDWMTEHA